MAMKPCGECKHEVSTSAKSCPHCGKPAPASSNIVQGVGGVIAAILVIAMLISLGKRATGRNTPAAAAPAVLPAPERVEVSPGIKAAVEEAFPSPEALAEPPEFILTSQLAKAYAKNELAADALYKGKLLHVFGIVRSVERVMGDPLVSMSNDIACYFKESEVANIQRLNKGDTIIFEGKCVGARAIGGGAKLFNCRMPYSDELVKAHPKQLKMSKSGGVQLIGALARALGGAEEF